MKWTETWSERCHVEDLHEKIKSLIGRRVLVKMKDGSHLEGILSTHLARRHEGDQLQLLGNLTVENSPEGRQFRNYLDIADVRVV
jgi:hypothetical protein